MQIKSEPTVRVIAGAFQGRDAAVLGEQFEEFVQANVPADWVVPLAAELAA